MVGLSTYGPGHIPSNALRFLVLFIASSNATSDTIVRAIKDVKGDLLAPVIFHLVEDCETDDVLCIHSFSSSASVFGRYFP